ncbi:hypothetical protein BGZ83_010293 [Gryganskiella cystojenkinii]|nr:hypothetical protein BGZ83_010293 [Gryganskiella cystojenkinii]
MEKGQTSENLSHSEATLAVGSTPTTTTYRTSITAGHRLQPVPASDRGVGSEKTEKVTHELNKGTMNATTTDNTTITPRFIKDNDHFTTQIKQQHPPVVFHPQFHDVKRDHDLFDLYQKTRTLVSFSPLKTAQTIYAFASAVRDLTFSMDLPRPTNNKDSFGSVSATSIATNFQTFTFVQNDTRFQVGVDLNPLSKSDGDSRGDDGNTIVQGLTLFKKRRGRPPKITKQELTTSPQRRRRRREMIDDEEDKVQANRLETISVKTPNSKKQILEKPDSTPTTPAEKKSPSIRVRALLRSRGQYPERQSPSSKASVVTPPKPKATTTFAVRKAKNTRIIDGALQDGQVELTKDGPWTRFEDEALLRATQDAKNITWGLIANAISGRNWQRCRFRWRQLDILNGAPWTPVEDDKLIKACVAHNYDYLRVAIDVETRTWQQCQRRASDSEIRGRITLSEGLQMAADDSHGTDSATAGSSSVGGFSITSGEQTPTTRKVNVHSHVTERARKVASKHLVLPGDPESKEMQNQERIQPQHDYQQQYSPRIQMQMLQQQYFAQFWDIRQQRSPNSISSSSYQTGETQQRHEVTDQFTTTESAGHSNTRLTHQSHENAAAAAMVSMSSRPNSTVVQSTMLNNNGNSYHKSNVILPPLRLTHASYAPADPILQHAPIQSIPLNSATTMANILPSKNTMNISMHQWQMQHHQSQQCQDQQHYGQYQYFQDMSYEADGYEPQTEEEESHSGPETPQLKLLSTLESSMMDDAFGSHYDTQDERRQDHC